MKWRFWQKVYLLTLVLFLLCINGGILSLTVYTHQKNVRSAEEAAGAQQYYAAMSFERDYDYVREQQGDASLLMQSFGAHYASKGLYLAFLQGEKEIYSNIPFAYTPETDSLSHVYHEDKRHLVITSEICGGAYTMVAVKNVEDLDSEFRSLMLIYLLTALGVSLFLAVGLYLVLRRLSKPLDELRETTQQIREGDFSVTARVTGNDEFTLLAESFNSMLDTINKQMEDLAADAENKQMLVDNMAHELRTPLTSIHGYAEYLEKAAVTEEKRVTAAKYILSEAKRLQKISELLLDEAYIRGNPPEMGEVELSAILCDTAEKLQFRAEERQVTILGDTAKMTVTGNETLLSMLFYNLTENAIKACAPGGTVRLSCQGSFATVTDNGKGMTEEQLAHITEPFYRTDKSRSRAEGGAGLGLALCQRIVTLHGGDMQFDSEPGKGTKVCVSFTTWQQLGDKSEKSAV